MLQTMIMDGINGPVRALFFKYAVQSVFTLYLQHRHHTVGNEEAVEGTVHLMDDETVGNTPIPTTWMIQGDKSYPMRFSLVEAAKASDIAEPSKAFVKEFSDLLRAIGAENLLGLDSVCAQDWTDSEARRHFLTNADSGTGDAGEGFIPVSFLFDPADTKTRVYYGKCKTDHVHSGKPAPKPKPAGTK
ncbi:hypothetical protein GGX14DRAFT_601788 [Mycena pura]|uniref:Uncharacterized protein n=1 Tax=Mycena pura TaxID=153505 RepID=A0AAD6VUR9_9AGAR|nr:hypothetical protein GGX14DRAFT_601788 [Mycena pura]